MYYGNIKVGTSFQPLSYVNIAVMSQTLPTPSFFAIKLHLRLPGGHSKHWQKDCWQLRRIGITWYKRFLFVLPEPSMHWITPVLVLATAITQRGRRPSLPHLSPVPASRKIPTGPHVRTCTGIDDPVVNRGPAPNGQSVHTAVPGNLRVLSLASSRFFLLLAVTLLVARLLAQMAHNWFTTSSADPPVEFRFCLLTSSSNFSWMRFYVRALSARVSKAVVSALAVALAG